MFQSHSVLFRAGARRALFACVGAALLVTSASVRAADDETPDPKAVELVTSVVTALAIENDAESAKALLPLVHKTLLTAGGDELSPDTLRFAFKKARANLKHYENPAKVVRVHTTGTTGIGFGKAAEKGKVVDYFLAKKNGMPSTPLKVFFPADGGAPKLSFLGGL